MNVALWIIAGLLAVGSLAGGAMKLVQPKEKLAASGWGWVEDFGGGTVKAIGALEILAAVGLILPAALDIVPILVPLAAVGLVLLMIGATITHLRRNEAIEQRLEIADDLVRALIADAHQYCRRRRHRLVTPDACRERIHGRSGIAAEAHDQKPDHGIPEANHRPGQGHGKKH